MVKKGVLGNNGDSYKDSAVHPRNLFDGVQPAVVPKCCIQIEDFLKTNIWKSLLSTSLSRLYGLRLVNFTFFQGCVVIMFRLNAAITLGKRRGPFTSD